MHIAELKSPDMEKSVPILWLFIRILRPKMAALNSYQNLSYLVSILPYMNTCSHSSHDSKCARTVADSMPMELSGIASFAQDRSHILNPGSCS